MDILAYCRENLQKSGLVFLDAHTKAWDIFLTARNIRKRLNPKVIIMPIAGYLFYVPILKQLTKWMANSWKVNFFPVYRKGEYEPVNLLTRFLCFFYPKDLSWEKRKLANKSYVEESTKHSQIPGSVIVVSPYGGVVFYGGKIKYGVKKLMETESNLLISKTAWNSSKLAFETKIAKFRDNLLEEYIDLTQISG